MTTDVPRPRADPCPECAGQVVWEDAPTRTDGAWCRGVPPHYWRIAELRSIASGDFARAAGRGADVPAPDVADGRATSPAPPAGDVAEIVLFRDVPRRPVTWLWPGWLPRGKLVVFDGDPGLGKSLVTIDVAARVTRGRPMPDGRAGEPGGATGVILVSAEDDPGDTIGPRLAAAGADLSRVASIATAITADGRRRDLTLADVDALEGAIVRVGAALVVIDPLMAYVPGRVDAHHDAAVRGLLRPLAGVAAATRAVIVVIRHLNKAAGGPALYRGTGSIAVIAAARTGWLAAPDPDDATGARRVLVCTKANLAVMPPAIGYTIATARDGIPVVAWGGASAHTATTLLAQPATGAERSARDEATAFLREELADGPRPAADLLKLAAGLGIDRSTLQRARADLGVISHKQGLRGGWAWAIAAPKISPHPEDLSTNGVRSSASGEIFGAAPGTGRALWEALTRPPADDHDGGAP